MGAAAADAARSGAELTLNELKDQVGHELGISHWITVDQARIDAFAAVSGDHQFIHVDAVRAAATPFGGTIAHGFLTLSLLPKIFEAGVEVVESRMGVNYGLNRVRFMSPVPVGKRLRARMKLLTADPIADDGFQMTWETTIELEGAAKPACVAESVVRRYR